MAITKVNKQVQVFGELFFMFAIPMCEFIFIKNEIKYKMVGSWWDMYYELEKEICNPTHSNKIKVVFPLGSMLLHIATADETLTKVDPRLLTDGNYCIDKFFSTCNRNLTIIDEMLKGRDIKEISDKFGYFAFKKPDDKEN